MRRECCGCNMRIGCYKYPEGDKYQKYDCGNGCDGNCPQTERDSHGLCVECLKKAQERRMVNVGPIIFPAFLSAKGSVG